MGRSGTTRAALRRVLSASRSGPEPSAWHGDRFPDAWPTRDDLSLPSDAEVVAVVHVYYRELIDELIGNLAVIPVPFDLIVTCASRQPLSLDTDGLAHVRRVVFLEVENRGRDLWPLAQLANAGLLDGYAMLVKVHTKRSGWRDRHEHLAGSGDAWRGTLMSGLLGDESNVKAILEGFAACVDLGMMTADRSVLGAAFWGQDLPKATSLLARLGIPIRRDELAFAAGSMYWARASVLRRIRDLGLTRRDFEAERGQVDGTTAHALERVIGLLCTESGLRIVERSWLRRASESAS